MTVNGPNNVGGGASNGYNINDLETAKLKKKAPLIEVFKKHDLNGDGKIDTQEAMMMLSKLNTDGKAEFSRKEFGAIEKEYGDMGRGERKVLNEDFLKNVFGSDDVQIITDGNKRTFKTQDGKFLGTVEQDGDKFTFLNEAGKKTKVITNYGNNNFATDIYDESGDFVRQRTDVMKGLGTTTTTFDENKHLSKIEYSGDNLIAHHKGIVSEEFYKKDGVSYKKTTDIDKNEKVYKYENNKWVDNETPIKAKVNTAPPETAHPPVEYKPTLKESFEKANNTVTIDEEGSNQRLTSKKQWQTTVKIPQKATVNENGVPSEIQIGLPSSYGKNAFQTLKLVDGTENIYTDKAGNRKFEVKVGEDGAITLKQLDAKEANDKIKAFLEANTKAVKQKEEVEENEAAEKDNKAAQKPAVESEKDNNVPSKAPVVTIPRNDSNPPRNVTITPGRYSIPSEVNKGKTVTNLDGTKTEYDENGYIESEYDKNGKLTRQVNRDESGKVTSYLDYEYDKNGKEIRQVNRDKSGKVTDYRDSEHDKNGYLTREIYRDASGKVKEYLEYEYDKNGKESRLITRDPSGNLKGYTEFEYNEDGDWIRMITKDSSGNVTGTY